MGAAGSSRRREPPLAAGDNGRCRTLKTCRSRSQGRPGPRVGGWNSAMNKRPSRAGALQRIRLAADIGGTFTDVAVFDERSGALTFGKALSTPQRLVEGINAGVARAGSDY